MVVRNGDLFVQNISISDFFPFVPGFLPFYILYFILFIVFATAVMITKAERLANFTIFHCRIRTNQPACWPFCTTSEWIWIFVPVAPTKRYHPSVGCHATLVQIAMFREFCFDWLHSGFYNDSKDRLQSEKTIAKRLMYGSAWNIFICLIDQAWGQDGWLLAEFFGCVFMDREEFEVHKKRRKRTKLTSGHFDE